MQFLALSFGSLFQLLATLELRNLVTQCFLNVFMNLYCTLFVESVNTGHVVLSPLMGIVAILSMGNGNGMATRLLMAKLSHSIDSHRMVAKAQLEK